ncbi:hypothetical protein NBRC10512_002949 [Rhodotorula toruloides]|uniref:RHTO0S20e00518g1_1 n=2 Tax=Rhodotorula toruloides TaxID=5286 RepID=A0A061BFL1_RHOTO|nr:uncharacterized protein RHTO_04267 [Rhodotorula toruloides NP11]EMS19493.1 hypothetical protein RHTO_04267 [Rhodotorula toruloides NP11]CDR48747.1 RHTO0S20e00518g1_1 [Rhodotorula toruloides]
MPFPNVFSRSNTDPPPKKEPPAPAPPKRKSTFEQEFHQFPEFHRRDTGHFTVHNGNQVVYSPPKDQADTKQSSIGKVPLSERQQWIYRQQWAQG